MSVKDENWVKLLTSQEKTSLIEYLYSLNSNINWNTIIEKHLNTTNEKFIKHIKSLTWEDHPTGILTQNLISEFKIESNYRCKNIYDHISELMFKVNFEKYMNKVKYEKVEIEQDINENYVETPKNEIIEIDEIKISGSENNSIKILKPDLNANISDFVKEYYVLIMEEYETFFKTFKIKYEYIDTEEDDCILLGSLTKDVKYNPTMILDYSFPINYKLSENYNKLMMLIFENINSNEFNFNILNYRFLTL